jgi:hypothetical protein
MYQQINLYQPVFRRQPRVFSALTLLQILGLASVVLFGFYLQASWTLNSLGSTVDSLSAQYRQLEARLGTLETTGNDNTASAQLEIARLQASLDERQSLLDNFSRLRFRESSAFGEFFETLATRTLPGLWLTGIRLTEDGETEIRGASVNPMLVPRYLQEMPAEPRFTALHNGSIQLARDDPARPAVSFILSSTREEL